MGGLRAIAIVACLCAAPDLPAAAAGLLDGLGDPMQPPAASVATDRERTTTTDATAWRLQAVRIGGSDRSVVINGKLFRLGQPRDGAIVTRISRSTAVLNVDGATYTLRLVQEDVKSGSTGAR